MSSLNDTREDLKVAKFLLNAGRPLQALTVARMLVNDRSDHVSAMAIHRVAMALKATGNTQQAMEYFEWSEQKFIVLRIPDPIGFAMTVRDHELYKIESCLLAGGKDRTDFERACLERIREACRWLDDLPSTPRIELERVVTSAFETRAEILLGSRKRNLRAKLIKDWQTIRELRGRTKQIYELDALEWVIRYCGHPALPNQHIRRAIVLSFEVGNLVKVSKYTMAPLVNIGFSFGRNLMRRFDE